MTFIFLFIYFIFYLFYLLFILFFIYFICYLFYFIYLVTFMCIAIISHIKERYKKYSGLSVEFDLGPLAMLNEMFSTDGCTYPKDYYITGRANATSCAKFLSKIKGIF